MPAGVKMSTPDLHTTGINGMICTACENHQSTLYNAITGFPAMWRLRNKRRYSILMMCHYSDLGSASKQISHTAWPIRSTCQIWVVTRITMEFMCLILTCHFAGKPVVESWNVRLPSPLPLLFSLTIMYMQGCHYSFEAAIVNEDLPITSHKKLTPSS